ncbi:hypothetical protein [Sphingobium bisphenolivorans]|uniref:hypothetical protein n=1 Tax=Sphingobium bisphenolivorans TaxID=1335760 RepID=UPI0003AAB99E|nr:hypothetical protein [Sphingobium bisphenolivorans]
MAFGRSFCALALVLALPLAGCGKKKEDDLNALDAQLTDNAGDALTDQIVVDPKLAGQRAARLPSLQGPAAKALAQSVKLAGGRLLATPAPANGANAESADALAAVAREQQKPGGNAFCRKQLVSGLQWASRLPEPFTVYPGAELKEAAGADKDGCSLRAATFQTPVPRQSVMDFYYTQARRAGFDAEHSVVDGNHVLGGTREDDGSAFLLLFNDAPGGKTSVDVIADNGR